MNPFIQKLKTNLAENPINYATNDPESLIEDLYWYYQENNPSVNENIQRMNEQLQPFLEGLDDQEIDSVFEIFYNMYREQEVLAFHSGMRFATQLILELME